MSVEDHTTRVEYREIHNLLGYRFGSDGTVWSRWRKGYKCEGLREEWRPIRGWLHRSGHRNIHLKFNGMTRTYSVHRLIATAFHGECPDGMECRHLNGISDDNRAENLRWGTPLENTRDQFDHGVFARGERCGLAKLTEDKVREIRQLHAAGMTHRALAARFGIASNRTICLIVNRKTWRHVD